MSMTVTQIILIVLAVLAIAWGIYILLKAIRAKNEPIIAREAVEHDKNGLPILPRHQRPEVDEPFTAEITPDNPDSAVLLSAENTELELPADKALSTPSSITAATSQTATFAPSVTSLDDTASLNDNGDDAFSVLANATESITPVVHTFDENQLKKETFSDNSPILDTHIQAQIDQEQNSPLNNAVQNINISIFSNHAYIAGSDLLRLIDKYGMKYGAMNMFHRYEHKDGTGLLWFSMMMITDDGIMPFDLNKLPNQWMKGLVLFLSLPHPKAVQGFDSMISVAGLIAHDLQATVYDETGEALTKENTQIMRDIAVNFGKQ